HPDLHSFPTRRSSDLETSFAPGKQSEPAWLVVRRMSVLSVSDAATRKPIESIHLVIRERGDGCPNCTGKFHAPGGRLCLVPYPRSEEHTSELQSRGHL